MIHTAEPGVSCYRHRGTTTAIRCARCERPICPRCMREAAVGFQCPDCSQPITPRSRFRGRKALLLLIGAAALGLLAGAVLWLTRSQAPQAAPGPGRASVQEAGLPAGFRSSPVVGLPRHLPQYPGSTFLGFDSRPALSGVIGTWLYVAPGGRCDQVLAYYEQALTAAGDQVTANGSLVRWREPAGTVTGGIECPFPTPTDASGAALSGPWIAIITTTT